MNAEGVTTWLDEEKMEGDIISKMTGGIEESTCVVVFLTKRYIEKVGGSNPSDNCKLEFDYAALKKTNLLMVSILYR